jgi:hypothetical protein
MSLNQDNKVPLPQRGIIKYKNKGTTYGYEDITNLYIDLCIYSHNNYCKQLLAYRS